MSLGKIGKKLRREATANPKKAVFLGLALLVAIYFWIPLAWGWVGKNNQNMANATVNTEATPMVSVTAPVMGQAETNQAATNKMDVSVQPSWPQTAQWIDKDPRTMPAPALTKTRDPFEFPRIALMETKSVEQAKPKPPSIAPNAVGLVLTSTIIGPQRRIAQISGKTYSVGQTIQVQAGKEKDALGVAFKLIEIDSRRAVLEANGQQFELVIPEPGKSGKMELFGTPDNRR